VNHEAIAEAIALASPNRFLSYHLRYRPEKLPRLSVLTVTDASAIIASILMSRGVAMMASLVVRNVDEEIVKALKVRAGRHGTSAEAEHRKILAEALLKPKKRSFVQVLASMPNVGNDADFERVEDTNSPDVLG
jgi:plasmid stability protein